MTKYFLSFGLLILISSTIIGGVLADIDDNEVEEEYQMYSGVKVYKIERQCAMVGGLCANKSDCKDPTSTRGLCPDNQHRGVECCFELKSKPAPCRQHAGECMDRCHIRIQRPGTDCVNGQVCCVLVRK